MSRPELPRVIVIPTPLSISAAAERLSVWLSGEPGIEKPMAHSASDRYLIGDVDGAHVHVPLRDANVQTRRKSWNVEFDGTIETVEGTTTLRGTIDVPDRRQLRVIVWMFRLAAVVPILFAIREALRGGAAVLLSAILATVIVVGVAVGSWLIQVVGEREATGDAALISTALNRLFHG